MLTLQPVIRILKRYGRNLINLAAQGFGSWTGRRCRQPAGLIARSSEPREWAYAWVD